MTEEKDVDITGASPLEQALPVLRVECMVMSRIVGYFSDTRIWHEGKKQEYQDRRTFDPAKLRLEDGDGSN